MSPTRTEPDLFSSLKTGWNDAMQQWWDQTQTAIDPWKQAWESVVPAATGQHAGMPYGHHHRHGSRPHHGGEPTHCGSYHDHATYGESCHCESCHGHSTHGETCHCESCHGHSTHGETCHCESCHGEKDGCASPCHCRVPDAEVVLHARAGEQRVIAFVLRNPWRREREVSIAVGSWQVCDGGRLEVQSVVEAGESVTSRTGPRTAPTRATSGSDAMSTCASAHTQTYVSRAARDRRGLAWWSIRPPATRSRCHATAVAAEEPIAPTARCRTKEPLARRGTTALRNRSSGEDER